MAKFKLNLKSLGKKLEKNKKLRGQVERKVANALEVKKGEALAELVSHPVSKEIEAGASASNSSGTLGGYGNLFSFIGFNSGSAPMTPLLQLIKSSIKLDNLRKSESKGKKIFFGFKVNIPSREQIALATPMPWEGGSWVEGVENGMSNFSYYMYKRFGGGRSGWGFQADHELRMAVFKPTQYVNKILADFRKDVKKNIKKVK
jgi:hypothetical protein